MQYWLNIFYSIIYHLIMMFLIHFQLMWLPLFPSTTFSKYFSHIFYSILYHFFQIFLKHFLFNHLPLFPNISHTFSFQSTITIVPAALCTILIPLYIICYSSSCSSAVLSVEELSLSVCVSVSSGSFIRSAYTALGSHIQCLWNDKGVLAAKKSAL